MYLVQHCILSTTINVHIATMYMFIDPYIQNNLQNDMYCKHYTTDCTYIHAHTYIHTYMCIVHIYNVYTYM